MREVESLRLHSRWCHERRRSLVQMLIALVALLIVHSALAADETEWQIFDSEGWTQLAQKKHDRARELFVRAIDASPDGYRLGRSKVGLAWALHRLGRHADSFKHAEEALPLTELGTTASDQAPTTQQLRTRVALLHLLGRLRCCDRNWQESRRWFEQATELQARFQATVADQARLHLSIAELDQQELRLNAAQQQLEEVVELLDRRRVVDELNVAARLQLADVLTLLGRFREAERYIPQDHTSSYSLFLKGRIAFREARYEDALTTLGGFEGASEPCEHASCTCANRLIVLWARTLVAVGDFSAADELLADLEARFNWEEALLESDRHVIASEIAYAKGDFESAESGFRDALTCREQTLSPEDPDLCHVLLGLAATIERRGGMHRETPDICRRVRTIRTGMGSLQHPDIARANTISGMHEQYHYRHADAELFCRDSVGYFVSVFGRVPHPDHCEAIEVLARSIWAQSDVTRMDEVRHLLADARSLRKRLHERLMVAGFNPLRFPSGNVPLLEGWLALSEHDNQTAADTFAAAMQLYSDRGQFHPFEADARLGYFLSSGPRFDKEAATAEHFLIQRLGRVSTAYQYACFGNICSRYECTEEAWWLYQRALELYRKADRARDIQIMEENIERLRLRRHPGPPVWEPPSAEEAPVPNSPVVPDIRPEDR